MSTSANDTADLLERYQQNVAVHSTFTPGDRKSLARTNAAADELRAIASAVGSLGVAAIEAFGGLLDHLDANIRLWAAFHSLEVMDAPDHMVRRAFAELEAHSGGESVSAFGTRLRLNELRQEPRFDRYRRPGGSGHESDVT
jgi:hypothetical protein